MLKRLRELDPWVHLLFFVAIVILLAIVLKLDQKIKTLGRRTGTGSASQLINPESRSESPADEISEGKVRKWINDELAKLQVTKELVGKNTPSPTAKIAATTYIPMSGEGRTTTSQSWYTIPASDFYLDLTGEYGSNAVATWEATLKIDGGNGQAFVRLWDDTHKIGVGESEISTIGNAEYETVYSRDLQFWAGRNLYKVQIKSLTGYRVTFAGGRLKINY